MIFKIDINIFFSFSLFLSFLNNSDTSFHVKSRNGESSKPSTIYLSNHGSPKRNLSGDSNRSTCSNNSNCFQKSESEVSSDEALIQFDNVLPSLTNTKKQVPFIGTQTNLVSTSERHGSEDEELSSFSTNTNKNVFEISNQFENGPQEDGFDVIAIYPFRPQSSDELQFDVGDRIRVLKFNFIDSGRDGWWFGQSGLKSGWFPSSYVIKA